MRYLLIVLFLFPSFLISSEPLTEDNNFSSSASHSNTQSNHDSTSLHQPSDKSSLLPPPIKPLPDGGTIKINCNKEDARVIINKMELGTTPFCRSGFYPGFYNIELRRDDCRPFSKMVQLDRFDTAAINALLEPISGFSQPVTVQGISEELPPETSKMGDFTAEPRMQAIQHKQSSLPVNPGTFDISCNIPSAIIIVNKAIIGKAPLFRRGFLPGYYEIEIKQDGYKPFYKLIQIKGNDTAVVQADLITELSRLKIKSIPANASVFLNGAIAGSTPFDTFQIKPATYKLRIELPDYVPIYKSVVLTPTVTDSMTFFLTTIAFRDSVKKVSAHRNKIARRVLFGCLTAGSVGGVIYYNDKVKDYLVSEREAWNRYQEHDLSGYEYNERFNTYKSIAAKTDQHMKYRKAFTILSLIGAAGLTISIPF